MANVIREGLQKKVVAYPGKPYLLAVEGAANKQIAIYSALARNSSGGSANVGIFQSFNIQSRKVYAVIDGDPILDVTTLLANGTPVGVYVANDDFVAYGTKEPSGLISVNVSTATGESGVYTVEYYDGSSLVTLNTVVADNVETAGVRTIVFLPPIDWAPGGVTGGDTDLYYVVVTATTAPDDVIEIDGDVMGKMLEFQEAVANGGGVSAVAVDSHKPLILDQGEGLIPYFSVADNANGLFVSYNTCG